MNFMIEVFCLCHFLNQVFKPTFSSCSFSLSKQWPVYETVYVKKDECAIDIFDSSFLNVVSYKSISVFLLRYAVLSVSNMYEGESNENRKIFFKFNLLNESGTQLYHFST
jgi:hypothetical protein